MEWLFICPCVYLYFLYLGISYYPINSSNGFIYTSSSNGLITRHTATLDKTAGTLTVTANSNVMNREPSNVSLISVDWLNDMLYWLEMVNSTNAAVSIMMYVCVIFYNEFLKHSFYR